MKQYLSRIASFALVAMLALAQLPAAVLAHGDSANLIANHDLETTAANGQPVGWTPNAWGDLTATHAYQDAGDAEYGMVAYTKVENYVDGDAKWYFAPVEVVPGAKYTFSDVYKATAGSELVAQYTHENGTVTYAWMGSAPAAADWTPTTYDIVIPDDATHVSVFHILPANGELWTDEFALAATPVVAPTGGNLVANPSMETASAGQPVGWSFNKWGDIDATATYDTVGQDGGRSLKVTVSRFVDGDAKWYFAPVSAEASQTYSFTNTYKASALSHTVVQIENIDSTYSYLYLGANPASTAWTQSSYVFAAPATAKKMSVFHVLAAVGELSVDSYLLARVVPEESEVGVITNPSVETVDPASTVRPKHWANNTWGANTAQFSYVNDAAQAHSGNRALRVDVTQYASGDAKWYFEPVALTPGADYRFTDWYASNVDTRVVLQITKVDGTVQYQELPIAAASGGAWREYSAAFMVPGDAAAVSAFHLLTSVGWLMTDDFSFGPYSPAGFDRGLVTLSFDDGWEDNISTALPMMDEFGYKSNQFYATDFIRNSPYGRTFAENTIRAIRDKGHEMGSHTVTHPDLTTLSLSVLNRELADSQAYLQTVYGQPITYFASPYGAYNTQVQGRIAAYYNLHRTVDVGYNSPDNLNVMKLKVQNVLSNTTAAEVQAWVEKAKADRTWLILVYHRVANDPGPYDTTPALFRGHLNAINGSGLPVVTMSQALAELQPQLAQ